jgi:hypothetical protein
MGQADTGEHRDGGSRGLYAFVADHDEMIAPPLVVLPNG